MQKHVNLVDLVKSFPTNICLQNLASIQKRTSPVKFAHLAEKSGKGSISNLSTKAGTGAALSPGGSSGSEPRSAASESRDDSADSASVSEPAASEAAADACDSASSRPRSEVNNSE